MNDTREDKLVNEGNDKSENNTNNIFSKHSMYSSFLFL